MTRRRWLIVALVAGLLAVSATGAIITLSFGGSLKDHADAFFRLAASGQTAIAYENFMSSACKKRTSKESLDAFLSRLGISQYAGLSTSEFRFKSDIAGWTGTVQGASGPLGRIRILFVKEDGEWKIEGIKRLPAEQSDATPLEPD